MASRKKAIAQRRKSYPNLPTPKKEGDIDLRGFLAIDQKVIPGYEQISYTVHIKGDGTPEQFQQIHEFVKKTSPNYYNIANAIVLNSQLVVE